MFYLSRGEKLALGVLVVGLLVGGGVLTYQRGVAAGRAQTATARFVEARRGAAVAPPPAAAPRTALPAPEPVAGSPLPSSPRPEAARPFSEHTAPAKPSAPVGPLSLNTATAAQLDQLPGIGPKLAQRILEHRQELKQQNGRGFTSVDQLLDVSGIGPKRFAALRDRVCP